MTWSRRVSRAAMVRAACGGDLVAPRAAGLDGEALAAELAQVVGGLADRCRALLPVIGADLGGEVRDGEAAGRGGEGGRGGEHGPDPRLVQVDAAGAGGAGPGGQRQLVEDAVGDEPGVDAVQHGAEPFGHAGQPGDDLGELLEHPPGLRVLVLCTIASNRSTRSPLV